MTTHEDQYQYGVSGMCHCFKAKLPYPLVCIRNLNWNKVLQSGIYRAETHFLYL